MIILGVDRNAGQFENPQKEVINFDHVLVNAVSGDNDKRDKRYLYSS
ncbi:MAG: hypothetical protein IJ642_05610 [Oscillospiraceae bacterium]|nr:hypothetical protein [Oscillospiraceae bacterium]